MITAINWITAHWADILRIGGAAYVLASMLVALMPESWSIKSKLVAILERLSFLAHKDSPGTLKLPMRSAIRRAPKDFSILPPPPSNPSDR
jgi:hypothetical protein